MRPTTTASNLFRRQLCPGSARMEAGLPDEDSEMSREGQLLHDYAAHPEYQRAVLKPNQIELLERSDALTKQVIDRVGLTGDYRDYIELQLGGKVMGKSDLIRFYLGVAIVIDKKFGFNVVERAELNLQLRCYAVLSYDFLKPLDVIFVSIVQPRAPWEEQITIAKYTPEDIEAARVQIHAILEASNKSDAPLIPGEEQCRYCKAKLVCPAFRETMMVPAVVTPDNALSVAAREAFLEKKLREISDENLEKVLEAIKLGAMIHDPALDEARKRIKAGQLTNYSLGKETNVRSVVDVRRALALLSLAGLDRDVVYDCVTRFSLTKLSDKLKEKNPTWKRDQVREYVDKKLASVIEIETRKERVIRK